MAEEKRNWVTWVEDKIGKHPVDNNKFGTMAMHYAFYRGDQYRIWDQTLGFLREVNTARETRSINNFCRMFVDMFTAKMLKGDPEPRFRPYPDNTEESDRNIAAVGNGMSQFWWKTVVRGSTKLRHQCQWGGMTGIGIGKLYYDKNKPSGKYVGDVDFETVNPFHFFPNPDARCDDEMQWAVHRFPKEKSLVEYEFGLEKDSLQADEKQTIEEKRVAGGKHIDNYVSAVDEDCVFMNDIWLKACKDYPLKWEEEKDAEGNPVMDKDGKPSGKWTGGRHVVVAGGKVLVDEPNPDPDMLPFFTFRVKPLPDELYGEGLLKHIIVIQRDANRIESLIQANASFMGNVKWLINRQANVLKSAVNNEEFGIMEYDGQVEPKQSQANPLPSHITGRWWDLYRKAMMIIGFTEAGRGDIPYRGSQTSPGVIKELKQSEDVIFAQDISEMTDYIQRVMRRWFYLTKKYCPEARQVEILGENRRSELAWFNAQEFIKDPDFEITVGSGFSQSQEAKMDQMIQFAQTGIFDKIPGMDWRAIGEQLLDYAGLNKISEDVFKDERQAKRNLQKILMGQNYNFSPYMNLPVHIKIFTDYIKNPEYDSQPEEIRAAIDQEVAKFQQILMQQQMAMQQPQPMLGPGNQQPQTPTAGEEAEAGAARRQATGQPVENMGNQPAEAGVL